MTLACPTNQLQWQRLDVILAPGFFCPLMQTPFALSSIFLGCRFCKHSTLVNWTYWMFNKPTVTVWKSPAKILQDVTYSIQTWAPRTTVSKLLSFVFVPHHPHFFLSLFFNPSITTHLNSKHGTLQTNTLTISKDKSLTDLILILKSQLWFTTYSIYLKKQDWHANANVQCWWCTLLDN